MDLHAGTRVLLGVSGGIAAYKAVDLVRRLSERGADVRVMLTDAAAAFVTPLTFQAVSGHPVRTTLLDPQAEAGMDHIELARWAERLVIAPATADVLARLAAGFANDLLTTVALACDAPLYLAPAMNQAMWRHPATQHNVNILRARGAQVLGPAVGAQACGEHGPGRMLEPLEIAEALLPRAARALEGACVLLTAGPTREPLDPVRFLSNRSSGQMGFALAAALRELGASVVMIAGPTALPTPPSVERIDVETALEMYLAVMTRVADCDVFVATAAVADYRPVNVAEHKIKKHADEFTLHLVRNPDILGEVAALTASPFTVGFAAETDHVIDYARAKLQHKQLNMIAANQVGGAQGGFECTDNALTVIWDDGQCELPMQPKSQLARQLAQCIAERYQIYHASSS
ncbi:phosphopantothenoylcysteine decarboxylase / phosphopantothenate--cysteine ligase [Allochromatium warmingii]|uniref:Coenzyme A biosynthesis bifunctional protein CoaBC n=1 Tax=Allochromatium warmingii TaxID=61595 RepID=A0A1H3F511_ALLWA|nr:bifunctional phosphopantothenoylcysteine decarboxylase/phosphopantothenate--cysteine ligase CoaBC [Allochromatium warmingii]SDX85264.1 phosphopantothenoylcysteine decarboxylase / phosphopantothenate--cysteine ligase [Allochromatium warmingii]